MQRLRGTRKNRCAGPIFSFGDFSGEARIGMWDLPVLTTWPKNGNSAPPNCSEGDLSSRLSAGVRRKIGTVK